MASLFLNWAIEQSTAAAYDTQWRLFAEWCRLARWDADRATPMQVVAYVRDLVMTKRLAFSSVRSALSAINHHFRFRPADNPVPSPEVSVARRSAQKAAPPPKPKSPLTEQMLLDRERRVDSRDVKQTRDFAMILLAFGSFLRRGELVELRCDDVKIEGFDLKDPGTSAIPAEIRDEKVIWLLIRSSKTNPTKRALNDTPDRWETVIVGPNRRHPAICPLLWLRRWRVLAQNRWPKRTRLFCQVVKTVGKGGSDLSPSTFAHIVKELAASLGFDPVEFAGHSTRRGATTAAIQRGIELRLISQMGRWKSDAVLLYVDNALGDMASFAVAAGGLGAGSGGGGGGGGASAPASHSSADL